MQVATTISDAKRGSKRSKRGNRATQVSVSASAAVSRAPKRRTVRAKRRSPPLDRFVQAYMNPFHHAPPKFGFDAFTQTTTDVAALRLYSLTASTAATAANAVFVFQPSTMAAGATPFSASNSSFLKVAFKATNASLLNQPADASNEYLAYPPPGLSTFASINDTCRVLTAAMQITVRYPATALPGRLFGLTTFDSDMNLGVLTVGNLLSNVNVVPIVPDGSGAAVCRTLYRPSDMSDFSFTLPAANIPGSTNISKQIVVATGWPSGTIYDIDVIAHYETMGGLLPAAGESENTSLSLAVTKESLAQTLRALPSVLSKDEVVITDLDQLTAYTRRTRSGIVPHSQTQQAASRNEYASAASSGGAPDGSWTHVGPLAGLGAAIAGEVVMRHLDGRRGG